MMLFRLIHRQVIRKALIKFVKLLYRNNTSYQCFDPIGSIDAAAMKNIIDKLSNGESINLNEIRKTKVVK